ncbi:FixH family protein [bacterium SCSIO 12827]|nr:FixH family protein [bacterium SCSIO 12827]
MIPTLLRRTALACYVALLTVSSALAGAADYEFQPVAVDVKNGAGSALAVRLIHKPTNKPVPGAVVFRTRLDMGPDKMAAMTAEHRAVPGDEPGVYRFTADLTMAGGWALRLMAKVQGEAETVQGVVVFQARN